MREKCNRLLDCHQAFPSCDTFARTLARQTQRAAHVCQVQRFFQYPENFAGIDGLHQDVLVHVGRHEDADDVRVVLFDLTQQLATHAPGHAVIRNQHIDLAVRAFQYCECGVHTRCRQYFVIRLDGAHEIFARQILIVYVQDRHDTTVRLIHL